MKNRPDYLVIGANERNSTANKKVRLFGIRDTIKNL